jgi:GT2 family glycosyltransferase
MQSHAKAVARSGDVVRELLLIDQACAGDERIPVISSGSAGHPDESRRLCVLVIAYGRADMLDACLGKLERAYPLVVVDNSRSPDTRQVAHRHGATYLEPRSNLGFAAGVNFGLTHIDIPSTDVLLLNPDALATPEMIEKLHAEMTRSAGVACAAPAQSSPGVSGSIPVCWPFPTPRRAWREAIGLGRFHGGWDYVIGSILLINGDALADVGGFDEGFFLYAEEADWQLRAVRRGWAIAYCPDVSAFHIGGATDADTSRRELRVCAGIERYQRKHHGALGWRAYQAATVVTALRRAVLHAGEQRREALHQARLYAVGPYAAARRADAVPPRQHQVPTLP